MSERLHIHKYRKSTADPFVSNQSKLLDKNHKPLMSRPPLIQTKLTINQPGDEYEQEADRVADQVMRMPEPGLQSKCNKCGEDEEKILLAKKSLGQVKVAQQQNLPTIVHEVLQSPGKPLDEEARAFMEPRFRHDFSNVRIHTDTMASESARAVNALAYTVGQDVIFSTGKFCSTTSEGKKLLAHELTHVIQQYASLDKVPLVGPENVAEQEANNNARMVESGGQIRAVERPPVLARQANPPSEVTVTGGGPNICSLKQHNEHIFPAVMTAQRWLASSIPEIDAFLVAPGAPGLQAVRNALNHHFHSTEIAIARQVRGRLGAIRTDMVDRVGLNVECRDTRDRNCSATTPAYFDPSSSLFVFCPLFFRVEAPIQANTMIHEIAHVILGGRAHIRDLAYITDRLYTELTPEQALTNADSFASFVQELSTGRAQTSSAPRDKFDCPDKWRPLIRQSIAHAQRWNKNAQTALNDRRPIVLNALTDIHTRYLGAMNQTSLDTALIFVDRVEEKLSNAIELECEPKGGGKCDTGAPTYGSDNLHLCPSWMNQNTDDRTETLLSGLYGYLSKLGDLDDTVNVRRDNLPGLRRRNLARFVRELNSKIGN